MRSVNIEERVGGKRLVGRSIPVHFAPWVVAGSVVEHNIDNHSKAALVALVDEEFVVVGSTVSLVGSEVETRVVTPRVIA